MSRSSPMGSHALVLPFDLHCGEAEQYSFGFMSWFRLTVAKLTVNKDMFNSRNTVSRKSQDGLLVPFSM